MMEIEFGSDSEETHSILEELLQNISHFPGPTRQKILRLKAHLLLSKPEEELNMIVNLVESHTPGLRLRQDIESDSKAYEANLTESYSERDYFISISNDKFNTDILLSKIAELPKEWTVIQVTPQFSSTDIFAITTDELIVSGVHLTLFNCGVKNKPFCITLPGGNAYSIKGDMRRLKNNLKEIYSIPQKKVAESMSKKHRKMYHMKRFEMEEILEGLLREIEDTWLGAWKCLFIGKYEDNSLEIKIRKLVKEFIGEISVSNATEKVLNILVQTVKYSISSSDNSLLDDISAITLKYCFPGENFESEWKSFWKKNKFKTANTDRHPVILIVDEALDAFPWEMISTLNKQPVSRISSLHLLYAIYKAHKDTIVDGYKIVTNPFNGKFILNPGLDLQLMEKRLKTFFEYWLPKWDGLVGKTPNSQEFLDALTSAEVFCYSGHGSGGQYCSSDKIQKAKIDSVVLLFGCGSSQLTEQGPSVEMYGSSQMYSLAGCPCMIGMLWVVTDIDTDVLTTNFLSTWIPNLQQKPWQLVNEKVWIDQGIVIIDEEKKNKTFTILNEPNLLRALCIAKNKMKYICNRAAVIARGIPVKLKLS